MTLDGLLTCDGSEMPRSVWWAYKAYAAVDGTLAAVNGTLGVADAVAAISGDRKLATATLGYVGSANKTLSLDLRGLASEMITVANTVPVSIASIPDTHVAPLSAPTVEHRHEPLQVDDGSGGAVRVTLQLSPGSTAFVAAGAGAADAVSAFAEPPSTRVRTDDETTAPSFRVVRAPAQPGLHAGNSYIAAVAQTIWADGAHCCGGKSGMKDGQCVGAEPVVGLKPCTGTPAEVAMKIKMGNVQLLEPHVREAKRHSADIIVFSEGALGIAGFDNPQGVNDEGGVASGDLAEFIPEPMDSTTPIIPCQDPAAAAHSPALHAMSCMARHYNLTIVYDQGDKQNCSVYPESPSKTCSKCPQEGVFRFNTQLALSNDVSAMRS